MLAMTDALIPVARLFPEKSPRWCAENCRLRRIPGAFKVGKTWYVTAAAVEALATGATPGVPSEAEALADLRARGVV
jgi:hypothetical protein